MNTSTLAQTTVNTQSIAFQFGVEAAQRSEPCVPEMIFIARKDQVNFAAGFEGISGVTEVTAQFTGSELPTVAAPKRHNWGDFNATRAINKVSAHLAAVESIFERTARETPHLAGELLWLPT